MKIEILFPEYGNLFGDLGNADGKTARGGLSG